MSLTSRALALALFLPPLTASAENTAEHVSAQTTAENLHFGFGARVGGYGFREVADGATNWTDCRMDGMGVFSTLGLGDHFFSEVSLDYYQAHSSAVDHGMDRESGHLLAAIGARMFPNFLLSPYVQLGGGAEYTRIKLMATGAERDDLLPTGFLGVGGEVNLTEHLKVGATVRMFLMAHPLHEDATSNSAGATGHAQSHHALTSDDEAVPLEYGAAGQAQFFLRYAL